MQTHSEIPAHPLTYIQPDDKPAHNGPFRVTVGSLLELSTMTRPNTTNNALTVARNIRNPSTRHWDEVLKILAYLNGTKDHGFTFGERSGTDLTVDVDVINAQQSR